MMQGKRFPAISTGLGDYLTKYFHIQEFQLRLRNLLDHQQKLRQHYQQPLTSPQPGLPVETVANKFLHSLYHAIEEQLDNSGLDVDSLAETAAMSRRMLYRKLATLTGLTPNEVIRNTGSCGHSIITSRSFCFPSRLPVKIRKPLLFWSMF